MFQSAVFYVHQENGFQPESVVNFLALLGWGPSAPADLPEQQRQSLVKDQENSAQEILTVDKLIRAFSLEGINRKASVLDEAKLLWMNKHYFKQKLSEDESLSKLAVQLQTELCKLYR